MEIDSEGIVAANYEAADTGGIIELSPIAAMAVGGGGTITSVNDPLCRLLDRTAAEIVGRSVSAFISVPGPGGRVTAADLPSRSNIELIRRDGIAVPADAFRRALADGSSLIFAVDVTDRKKAELAHLEIEKNLWQSHRIEALGRLAGGIAHDFNNFLAVLLLHVDILELQLDDDSPIRSRVKEIKEVAGSIAGTVRQLFAFGRKQPMTLAPAMINPVIERFAGDFAAASREIDVRLDLAPALGLCFVDQVQIVQVLQNLALNARDAMPRGGTLRIETANVEMDADSTRKVQAPGPYIQITVTDTGVGMEKSTEDYIFEPFFSTKGSDNGTGLALAMVYGIVKQSKGFIWVDSELGKGTTFRIQFPRIDVAHPVSVCPNEAAVVGPAAAKTVLLVDDEPAVCRITAEFLRMSGLEVLQAENGMHALEIAQAHHQPIHLLLTDLSMPLMDGRETAERITRLHPETAVLFMSGNIGQELGSDADPAAYTDFVAKPFSSTSLTEKVFAILSLPGD